MSAKSGFVYITTDWPIDYVRAFRRAELAFGEFYTFTGDYFAQEHPAGSVYAFSVVSKIKPYLAESWEYWIDNILT